MEWYDPGVESISKLFLLHKIITPKSYLGLIATKSKSLQITMGFHKIITANMEVLITGRTLSSPMSTQSCV